MMTTTGREISRQTSGYWAGRWDAYLSDLCDFLGALRFREDRTLELGPGEFPLVPGSLRLDRRPGVPGRFCEWDATAIEWPIETGSFDLALAIQFFEHVPPESRRDVFAEARRVAGALILSIPYRWRSGSPDHVGLGDAFVRDMSAGEIWRTAFDLDRVPDRVRRVYVFDRRGEQ